MKTKIKRTLINCLMLTSLAITGFSALSAYDWKTVKANEEGTCCYGSYECDGHTCDQNANCSSTIKGGCKW